MAISVYQNTNPSVSVYLTQTVNEVTTPFNASGYALYLAAKQTYASTDYLFNIGVTGLDSALSGALTGWFVFPMTTGDTSYCPSQYPCGLTLVSPTSGVSKTAVDGGFVILPTV